MTGYADVLIGTQFGDEGKGKVVDRVVKDYQLFVRYAGGPNAGHSMQVRDKKIILHQVPSGIFSPSAKLYIGSGCALNLEKLLNEIEEIKNLGISLHGRLKISDRAAVICPVHQELDAIFGKGIGTTSNGIGPAYAARAQRSEGSLQTHIRVAEIIDNPNDAKEMMISNYLGLRGRTGVEPKGEIDEAAKKILVAGEKLKKYISRDPLYLKREVDRGYNVLFEGAQGAMLDIVQGTVPYVTATSTLAAQAYVGGDLPTKYNRKVIGVCKSIMSRVGNGPFVSEFGGKQSEVYCAEGKKHGAEFEREKYDIKKLLSSKNPFDLGIALRILGKEYGATTARPRRLGMLDLVALRNVCELNGVDELYLTKLDMLQDFSRTNLPGIPFVTAYHVDGCDNNTIPTLETEYRRVQPVITYFPPITEDLSNIRRYQDLPSSAKNIIQFIGEEAKCKIKGIGVGPEREQFIEL